MPDLPDVPTAAHQAAGQAKELARKGVHAATTALDAGLNTLRTVRGMVRTDDPVPPPTDAQTPAPVGSDRRPTETAPTGESPAEPRADLPVKERGPAPHIPPSIAGEVERDYGEELPGFRNGDEPSTM